VPRTKSMLGERRGKSVSPRSVRRNPTSGGRRRVSKQRKTVGLEATRCQSL
jgi:hypothetical protein